MYASVAEGIGGTELAREVARAELAALRGARLSSHLDEGVRLGVAVDLSMAEMERCAGCSRQTVYNALARVRGARGRPTRLSGVDPATASRQVLTTLVSREHPVLVAELREALAYPSEGIVRWALLALESQQLCVLRGSAGDTVAESTDRAEAALRARLDDLVLGRAEGFVVYLVIDPDETLEMAGAVRRLISSHAHALIEARVAPSLMSGPELALSINAPTSRAAIAIAEDVWAEICRELPRRSRRFRVVATADPASAPSMPSGVLDAFVDAVSAESDGSVGAVLRERRRFSGGAAERDLVGRMLTATARVARRAAGNGNEPRQITSGDDAFDEMVALSALNLEAARDRIRRAAVEALSLAVESFGPFRGGRLAAVSAPGAGPAIVESFDPTEEQLVAMASQAGHAIGMAATLDDEAVAIDPAALTAQIVGASS